MENKYYKIPITVENIYILDGNCKLILRDMLKKYFVELYELEIERIKVIYSEFDNPYAVNSGKSIEMLMYKWAVENKIPLYLLAVGGNGRAVEIETGMKLSCNHPACLEIREISYQEFVKCYDEFYKESIINVANEVKNIDQKVIENVLDFYIMATKLKNKVRSGWDLSHWNVSAERLESVAEHVYGTCILALSLDSEIELSLDINKVLTMLVLHEIGEVIIGDITPYDGISLEEKKQLEHKAMTEVLSSLNKKDYYYDLLVEFDNHETPESKFAHYVDKLEADIQCKLYQEMGCQRALNELLNENIYNSDKYKKALENGATTAFDIWYESDKSIYEDDYIFARLLKHVKDNNIEKEN